ncbi:outer membrane protein assembly factor BamB [Pseudoduganella namucuonensis]|uniref:Outer membrane protein assembly factor BamB n=1 Tax=Pseudoduganella namucuonensis TaxID=1035707 RepID=A0A1I7LC07_9BURK|nr:outer membrane protein assembly factor BamB [Pseudoduganella namucuonensis]SFV07064.1 Beta-barrel assembly machine subunit BamB [Pseudoduganella namucuonensis]
MRITGKVFGVSLLALAAGCSSLSSLNPFAAEEKNKPAPLVELKGSIAVKTAWKYSVGKSGAYSFSPALAGNSLFVADADGNVARLDAATGKEQWRVKAGSDLTAGVGASPNGQLVVVGGVKGNVIAFDGNGKQLWKSQASSEVLSSPVAADDVVIVRSVDNRVTAYEAKTGAKRWTVLRTTPALTLRNAPGMVIAGGNVYVGQPGGKLLALTLAAGVPRFEVSVGEPKGATELERVADVAGTPAVFDKDVCAVTYQGRAGCFDLATGAARWTKPTSSDVGVGIDQRFVFVADEQGAVSAYSREGGQSAWKNDKLAYRRLSTPASFGRAVAVGDLQGHVHLLSREDGALIGRVSTDGTPIVSVPVVAGSNLIFQTQSGTVTAIAVE